MSSAVWKVTDVFPKNSEECLELYNLIKEKSIKSKWVTKPMVLISIDSGIAYVFEMNKSIPTGKSIA